MINIVFLISICNLIFNLREKKDRRSSKIKLKEWKTFELTRKLEKFEEIKKEGKKVREIEIWNINP